MRNIIIGTAGHVDHGKTQLIRALTGVDTDRLKEEKKRGITIDLGFAWLPLPDGERAGIIDVPGHERFIKNMLAGAGGINLCLLVIAADDGVMPQTREHLAILRMLDIQNGIVVLTKADLVDEEWIEAVKEDVDALTKGTFLQGAPIAAVSSITGEGIDTLRELIISRLATVEGGSLTRPFRIPVDRVFSVEGFGTVITGTLIEGSLSEGDEVEIYPERIRSRVRNLQVHECDVDTAYAGQRVAVNLAGIKRDDIGRGDTVAMPGSMESVRLLDVKISCLKESNRVLKNGSRLHFYHGARETLCKLVLLGQDALEPGQEAYAQLKFTEDIAAKKGDRFIARFYSPIETVGGGIVLDANPKRHKRSDETVREALSVREAGSELDTLLQMIADGSPQFLPTAEIQKQSSMDADAFRSALYTLLEEGRAVRLSGKVVIADEHKETLSRRLTKILRDYHAENPLQAGMRRDMLRGRLLPGREISLVDRVLALYEADELIRSVQQKVALIDFQIVYSSEEQAMLDSIRSTFEQAAYAPPTPEELQAAANPKDRPLVRRVFDAMVDDGILLMVSPQMAFLTKSVESAFALLSAHVEAEGQITLAEFRDMIGTSRKFALELLSYYDKQNITRLVGDARVLVKRRQI